jgi:DNA polymerase elongation subunit (family B)
MSNKTKVLLYDIETAPILGYVWNMYEANVLEIVERPYILCFSYKWLGERSVKVVSLLDFPLYNKDPKNDRMVVKEIRKLLDEADFVIGHNSNKFDNKWANKRMVYHGLTPASPSVWIDTLQIARRYFKFESNRLDDLAAFLGVGRKVVHHGFPTWKGCMRGDMKAWREMLRYAKQDTRLLEKVYLKLRPFDINHPNINALPRVLDACPKCGSKNIVRHKERPTRVGTAYQYQCKSCGGYSTGKITRIKGMEIR